MNCLERFLAVMEYEPVDQCPNHELGAWPQTVERWLKEGMAPGTYNFNWFVADDAIGLDRREYIPVNYNMLPPFDFELIEKTDRYEIFRDGFGIVHKALIDGSVGGGRMCMDQYLDFPVKNLEDFRALKKRYIAAIPERYPANLTDELVPLWKQRDYPLQLGHNCSATGFYWRAREWMGTEELSLAWYDQPELMHEMMEFFADFTIENSRPVLEQINVETFTLNEDLAMKGGTLLSPATYREFIFPHLKRLIEFLKSHGVRYVCLDSDGYSVPLIDQFMDAGVDVHWPLERASDMDPVMLRAKFGKSLRLWGGVDKRELAKDRAAIDAHLKLLQPLVEEGGFIPTVDHTVDPAISYDNFQYYIEQKHKLLRCEL